MSKSSNIASKIKFLGKKSKEEVLQYLKLSDVFVLPSREDIWGLVINEAVANGLAVISTKQVGASFSLINEGSNGYIINCDNEIELLNAIEKAYANNLQEQQALSLKIAQEFTIENMTKAHLNFFKKINANTRN
jgi:glycosyltransferase involved in cell wall biosynthesis